MCIAIKLKKTHSMITHNSQIFLYNIVTFAMKESLPEKESTSLTTIAHFPTNIKKHKLEGKITK